MSMMTPGNPGPMNGLLNSGHKPPAPPRDQAKRDRAETVSLPRRLWSKLRGK